MEPLTTVKTGLATITIYRKLAAAYNLRQQKSVEEFIKFIDLRYSSLTPKNQKILNDYIKSAEGQNSLANYAESITRISCSRARMAVAMLYCKDSDFIITAAEEKTLLNALVGMDDDLLDFFLLAVHLPEGSNNNEYPYSRVLINEQKLHQFDVIRKWEAEDVFVYIHELIRIRLLLPDPEAGGGFSSAGAWHICYGVSNRSKKMASLINKADTLINHFYLK